MAFAKGLIEIDKAVEASSASFGPNLKPLFWKKDKESYILRFLTDDVIIAQWAEYIETAVDKKDDKGNVVGKRAADFLIDPDGTNWVEHFGGKQREYGTGNLIDPKYVKKGVGVAVLRKEVGGPDGRPMIVDDVTVVEKDGKKYNARQFVFVKMSVGNFWDTVRGIGRRNDTIIDRDFLITRIGTDKNTKYDFSPIGPEESEVDLRDPAVLHEFYGYGNKWDDSNPDRHFYCPQTLDEWAEEYSGKQRAEYFLKGLSGSAPVQTIAHETIDQNGNVAPAMRSPLNGEDETVAVSSGSSRFASVREQLKASIESAGQ